MSPTFRILILYGSQTGTAKAHAELISLQACKLFRLRNYPANCPNSLVRLCPADEYQPLQSLANEPGPVIFVCSTTGCGVPPDNMSTLWRKIMNVRLPEGHTFPTSLRFVVLGFGDSSYKHYNYVAKKLYRRLVHLGASPLPVSLALADKEQDIGLGLADEAAPEGVTACLQRFLPSLWNIINTHYSKALQPLGTLAFPLTWEQLDNPSFIASFQPRFYIQRVVKPVAENCINGVQFHSEYLDEWIDSLVQCDDEMFKKPALSTKSSIFLVKSNVRLTPDDYSQDTRLIELEPEAPCEESPLDFLPGSIFHVQPSNSIENVLDFFMVTGVKPSARIRIDVLNEPMQPGEHIVTFPMPGFLSSLPPWASLSMAWLATHYFDLNAIPSRLLFSRLAATHLLPRQETPEDEDSHRAPIEFARLQELGCASTTEAVDDLYDYVNRPRRRVVEVLSDFPYTAALVPPEKWIDILPGPMLARPYSIASAAPRIELLVAVVSYRTRMSTPRRGLATTYLSRLSVGARITGWISRPPYGFDFSFSLHPPAHPCILIGPGTGVAPFRAFIWYQKNRQDRSENEGNQSLIPQNVLFFGCRFSKKDFYFKNEWEQLESTGSLKLITAFSREDKGIIAKNRTYVQHRIIENSDLVWNVLSEARGSVFIAGSAKAMPTAVREAIISVVRDRGEMSDLDAEAFVSNLESSGRYQVEAWS